MLHKVCNTCDRAVPMMLFSKDKTKKDGLCGMCQPCNQKRCKEWAGRNKDRLRSNSRRRLYGITNEEFARLLETQAGACAICKQTPSKGHQSAMSLHVDHCHTTGKIRGLLCNKCNSAIGFFQESAQLTARATEYLGKEN